MYTYDMYRLVEVSREWLLEQVRARLKNPLEPPQLGGRQADLATASTLFYVAETSALVAELMPPITEAVQAGWTVVLVVPEPFRDSAGEAWDYLPDAIKPKVKIMPLPVPETL